VVLLQPNYNVATRQVELIGDTQADITMTSTVPLGLMYCSQLSFSYDHVGTGFESNDCIAFFNEQRLEHMLNVRVQPRFGCNSYTSLMQFKPFDRPSGENMWIGYVPDNITVRLQCN